MNEPTLVLKPATQHYVEVKSDPEAGKWYSHQQTTVYEVIGASGNNFRVVCESDSKSEVREIPGEDCRYFTSVLEYLKHERVFELYRDEETHEIVIEEACDHCFSIVLDRDELEALAHEILIFAWSVPASRSPKVEAGDLKSPKCSFESSREEDVN